MILYETLTPCYTAISIYVVDQSFNPTRQDRMVVWVFTRICISVKMETTSFFFCAWGLHERAVNVFAPRIHFPIAFLSSLRWIVLIAKIPLKFTVA